MLVKRRMSIFLYICCAAVLMSLPTSEIAKAVKIKQIPTVAIPTVTGTPTGAIVTVNMDYDQVNVRSGPNSFVYPIIGVLIAGQKAPALGKTVSGDWILIAYPGVPGGVAWVYSPNVKLEGEVPLVDPPPTPTPKVTPTIDPTLAAQFIVEIPPTRMPTYTPPPPLVIPTLPGSSGITTADRLPFGFLIVGMGVVGLFGLFISFLRGR